jgi:hypothetical protein
MTTGDVACFVRKHADDLVGVLRLDERPGIDENTPAVSHERVERAVIDDDHFHVLLRKACDAQDRLRIFTQQLLDFRIADDGRPFLRLRGRMRKAERSCGCQRNHAYCSTRQHSGRSVPCAHVPEVIDISAT